MAGSHRYDSRQVRDLIQFDDASENGNKENKKDQKENSSKGSTSKASYCSCSCTCSASSSSSSSSKPSGNRDVKGRPGEWYEPGPSQEHDGASSSCCELRDLKQLRQFHTKLGPLTYSSTHTVLIDVRICPLQFCLSPEGGGVVEMAGSRRNDSDQVRDLIQFDEWYEPGPSQEQDGASSSCELRDLKRLRQFHTKLGPLTYSSTHTVLIDVPIFNRERKVLPQTGRDIWNSNLVKMPDSSHSLMPVKDRYFQQSSLVQRWQVITYHLGPLAKKASLDVDDLAEAIIKYNQKYKDKWTFDALYSFVKVVPKTENYYARLFPKIIDLALKLPHILRKVVPLLQGGQTASITLSQLQIACLLANAFFCTFPHRNTSTPKSEYHNYPTINFSSLFWSWSDRKKEKLRAIMHYFKVVTDEKTKPKGGLVTFERRCLSDTDIPDWRSSEETMPKLYVSSKGDIETDGTGMLQVDFASSWIGGGVLGSDLEQEEILFLINPELIISRLFTEKLGDRECLIITGSQQYSSYSGYGDSFEWTGPYEDKLQRDDWARLQRQILAIDALNYRNRREQFKMINVTRELNKAYCGFKSSGPNEPDIATGKWGCGAFNGDPHLKAVIQLMAAAEANRGMAFFTFGDEYLEQGLKQIHHLLVKDKTTVGKLYGLLEDFCAVQKASGGSGTDLFEFIRITSGHSRRQKMSMYDF